jgi:hypothetical protein
MVIRIQPVQAQAYEHELYVNGFTPEKQQWSEVGVAPWLDWWGPDDGNYIEGTYDRAQHRWFTFKDLAVPAGEVITKVVLEGYTDGPLNEDVDYDVYTQDFLWLGSLYADDSPKWVTPRWVGGKAASEMAPDLLTQSGLNSLEVTLYFYDPKGFGGEGNIIDALRLRVYTAISVTIDFTPGQVSLTGPPNWLVCTITLPSAYEASYIDQNTIMLEGQTIPPDSFTPSGNIAKLTWTTPWNLPTVKSHIADVVLARGLELPGPAITGFTLTMTFDHVIGTTTTPFAGSDTVIVTK